MSVQLSDYEDLLEELGEHAAEVLQAVWSEAVRVFTPRALQAWLEGAAGLKALGRGTDVVVSFIESAPLVAREIGEEAVFDLLSTGIRLFSKTSAEAISMLFSTAPTAAERLGDAALFRDFLSLMDHVASKVPRAFRPMLEVLEVLLGKLTLGGLRRWVAWGISAFQNDLEEQVAYFGLKSERALAVLKKEQRGVLFVNVQRRLIMYLRSLWARDFFLRPTSGDFETREGYRPYIEHYVIHLPDAYDDIGEEEAAERHLQPATGMDLYRAAAAHAAAHVVHTRHDEKAEERSALQRALIGIIEDARVEALSIANFPGLKQLWKKLLPADASAGDSLGPLLDRIARALVDDDWQDDHPLVQHAVRAFRAAVEEGRLEDERLAWEIGLELAQQAQEMGIAFNARTDVPSAPYRDDNRCLWESQQPDDVDLIAVSPDGERRKYVSVMEFINTVDVETAGDDAQEIWVLKTELFPYEDYGISYNEMEGKEPVSSPYHYHEWDYQTHLERPNWVTLLEKRPVAGEPERIEEILERHRPLVRRLKNLIESMQPQGVVRQRKVEGGDQIDLNLAIEAMIDIRRGMQPDPRIGIRTRLQVRDLAVLLLIDLSESTNDPIDSLTATVSSATRSQGNTGVKGTAGEEGEDAAPLTVLDVSREAAAIMAEAISLIGDPLAIHGFASNGRHDVEYYRFKDFDEPFSDAVKGRLAAMKGELSTRMGAALRHAGHILGQQPSQKKLLFLISDGEPADNDVRDPQYLRHDAKKAVEELARAGITTFCLTIDPNADEYVSRIFGPRNYLILEHVARLPEKLPELYLSLTK